MSSVALVPALHVIYRYAAAAGVKPRPAYFSKDLALTSFVRALTTLRARGETALVTFLVDGPISDSTLNQMSAVGSVVRGTWGSNRRSYSEQIRLATTVTAELVWFAEDDYLYAEDALTALVAAVRAAPDADWFALSGPTPLERLELRKAQSRVRLPRSRVAAPLPVHTDGHRFRRIDSTTSTFGGRPRAIARVSWLLHACPWSGAAWDRTTCLAIQGATPYPWRYVLSDLLPPSTPPQKRALRVAWRVLSRVGVNLLALTQRRDGAVLLSPATPLVAHMDMPYEESPERWDAEARALLGGTVVPRTSSTDADRLRA